MKTPSRSSLKLLMGMLLIIGLVSLTAYEITSIHAQPSKSPNTRLQTAGGLTGFSSDVTSLTMPGDEFWDDRFDVLGVSGYVRTIAVSGSSVFVGGNFSNAGGVPGTSSIARWNSTTGTWSALGSGINGYVSAIAVDGDDVYVGGLFNAVGGFPSVPGTQSIARWNTTSNTWSALGSGIPGTVTAIAVDGDDVYVGGTFNAVGGFPSVPGTQSIARWNTTSNTWTALGSGIPGHVHAIAVDGADVYVGGTFNAVGGFPSVPNTRNIARWNTNSSTWSALGSGVSGWVYALGVGDGLYVGGIFNIAGDKPSRSFGRWFGFEPPLPPPPPPPPPLTGSISGYVWHVTKESYEEGLLVQVCPATGGACVWSGITDENGLYTAIGLPDGTYEVTVNGPSGDCWPPVTVGPFTIANGESIFDINFFVGECQAAPPPDTEISPSNEGDSGVPVVHWKEPLTLTTTGCAGGIATYEIVQDGAVLSSGPMLEGPSGVYNAAIAPLHPSHGRAEIQIMIECLGGSSENINFNIYIDPSGFVRTIFGTPVEGATVTLFYFDFAAGDFVAAPDGDAIMSPENRTNPDMTNQDGHFGWDVVAGFYKVRAEKDGCVAPFDPAQAYVETDVLVIPPPVTDLDLRLDCGESVLYLPLIQR
jgi:hypothetical protein